MRRRPRPNVESVEVVRRRPSGTPDRTVTIDGVKAERYDSGCDPAYGRTFCATTVYFPSHDTSVQAFSSTGAAELEGVLAGIRVLPHRAGVPGFRGLALVARAGAEAIDVKMLADLGLRARILRSPESHFRPGRILKAAPCPGMMLAPGSTVTMLVAAPGLVRAADPREPGLSAYGVLPECQGRWHTLAAQHLVDAPYRT